MQRSATTVLRDADKRPFGIMVTVTQLVAFIGAVYSDVSVCEPSTAPWIRYSLYWYTFYFGVSLLTTFAVDYAGVHFSAIKMPVTALGLLAMLIMVYFAFALFTASEHDHGLAYNVLLGLFIYNIVSGCCLGPFQYTNEEMEAIAGTAQAREVATAGDVGYKVLPSSDVCDAPVQVV